MISIRPANPYHLQTTANEFHETLALASLLEIDFRDTIIETQGLGSRAKIDLENEAAVIAVNGEKDRLMKEFWKIFDKRWPDSIPPGIIFLPGERVQIRGFGWAPRTWLSAHEADFPDPLSFIDSIAELDVGSESSPSKGLRVRYPGFLLYAEDRNVIFSTDKAAKTFQFPVDQSLQEWYSVEAVDHQSNNLFLEAARAGTQQLAIILSRPRPQESPSEIGLLVQIYGRSDETVQTVYRDRIKDRPSPGGRKSQKETHVPYEEHGKPALHCEILHRVKVSRDATLSRSHGNRNGDLFEIEEDAVYTGPNATPKPKPYTVPKMLLPNAEDDKKICIGEILDSDQIWYVDGFVASRASPPVSARPKDPRGPMAFITNRLTQLWKSGTYTDLSEMGSTGSTQGPDTEDSVVRKITRGVTMPVASTSASQRSMAEGDRTPALLHSRNKVQTFNVVEDKRG